MTTLTKQVLTKDVEPLAVGVTEAAKMMSVHPNTVRRCIRDGRFPHTRVGTRVLIPVAGLKRFLNGEAAK